MSTAIHTLGDVAEFINGVAFKPEDWGEEGVKIIRIQNLNSGSRMFNRTLRQFDEKFLVRPGDLLVSWSATLGVYVWEDTEDGALNQHIFRVLPRPSIDKGYLRHALVRAITDMDAHLHGATMKHVNRGEFLGTKIHLPPLNEQRRIASILDRAEGLRAKRRSAIALLDHLPRAIFLEMFGNRDDSWPFGTVSDALNPTKGSIRTGPFGSQLLHSEFVDSGVAVLGIDNAVANEFRWSQRRYISSDKYEQLKRYTVQPGDVLITIMGTCGRCAIVPADIPLAINSKHLCCITLDSKKCLPEYMHACFLYHPDSLSYLSQTTKGAVMGGLNMEIIKNLPLRFPPVQLQEKFAHRVNSVLHNKSVHQSALKALDSLSSALQAIAFDDAQLEQLPASSVTNEKAKSESTSESSSLERLIESYRDVNLEALGAARKAIDFPELAGVKLAREGMEWSRALSEMLTKQTEMSARMASVTSLPRLPTYGERFASFGAMNGIAKLMEDSLLPGRKLTGLIDSITASQITGMGSAIESIRRLTVANSLDTSVAQMMAGFAKHQTAIDVITQSWRKSMWVDIQKSSSMFERLQASSIPREILEIGSMERFNAVRLLHSTTQDRKWEDDPEANTAIEIVRTEYLDSVESGLQAIDPRLLKMFQGAKLAGKSQNVDRARHVAVSLREMTTHLLHILAPTAAIKGWSTSESDFANGKPTRASRIRFIYSRYGTEVLDFFEGDIKEAIKWIDRINGETHALDGFESDGAIEALIARFEGIALSLIRGARGFE